MESTTYIIVGENRSVLSKYLNSEDKGEVKICGPFLESEKHLMLLALEQEFPDLTFRIHTERTVRDVLNLEYSKAFRERPAFFIATRLLSLGFEVPVHNPEQGDILFSTQFIFEYDRKSKIFYLSFTRFCTGELASILTIEIMEYVVRGIKIEVRPLSMICTSALEHLKVEKLVNYELN